MTVIDAQLTRSPEDGYVGSVTFRIEGHKQPYEVSLASKSGRDWDYSLQFANESGPEEEIDQVDAVLEDEDDDMFDALIDAALAKLG